MNSSSNSPPGSPIHDGGMATLPTSDKKLQGKINQYSK